jgi:hypothetical protein
MNKVIKSFETAKLANKYFKSIKFDYFTFKKEYAKIGFADIYIIGKDIYASSNYHSTITLNNMLETKGKNW